MIVLNLKVYEQSFQKAVELTEIAKEVMESSKVRVVICPPSVLLRDCAEKSKEVFAQHTDENKFGAFSGSLPAGALKLYHVRGSLVNHSEKRIPLEKVEKIVKELKEDGLESIVCAENPEEVKKICKFEPSYIAIEPKELIGSGISVSNAKPEVITDSLKALEGSNVPLLCGAGVSNKEDVKKALELGAKGVLLASAFVKSEKPREFLKEFVSVF